MSHDVTNKVTVCPVKTQISLGILPVWSESSLCAEWVANDPSFLHVDRQDSDQTGWMSVACIQLFIWWWGYALQPSVTIGVMV